MHEDKGKSVEAYLDWPSMTVFLVEITCSSHAFSPVLAQNEAMMSACGGVMGKEHKCNKMLEM